MAGHRGLLPQLRTALNAAGKVAGCGWPPCHSRRPTSATSTTASPTSRVAALPRHVVALQLRPRVLVRVPGREPQVRSCGGRARGARDFVWVHDYHLMLVARSSARWPRARGPGSSCLSPSLAGRVLELPWRDRCCARSSIQLVASRRARRANFTACLASWRGGEIEAAAHSLVSRPPHTLPRGRLPITRLQAFMRAAAAPESPPGARAAQVAATAPACARIDRLD